MSISLAEFTEHLVPISDFSQGKAGKIFSDVANNNKEYVVLKNNQPTAVVISIEEYRRTQRRIKVLEMYFEKLQDMFLEEKAKERANDESTPFKEFIEAEGFTLDELKEVMDEVEFE